jgi:CBS domain containing-hemolysin-like protein
MRKALVKRVVFFGAAISLFFSGAFVAFAQSGNPLQLINPLSGMSGGSTVNSLIVNIGKFMVALAVPICGIMVIVGAFQMMTAAGDPTKFGNGKKTLLYAAVGFVIVLFASSVVPLLKSVLGG